MGRGRIAAAVLLGALAWPAGVTAEDAARCAPRRFEVPLVSSEASAGALANALGRAGSMRTIAAQMLNEASIAAHEAEPPGEACPAECLAPDPEVVLSSIPVSFRADAPDAAHCDALHDATSSVPFVYERSFGSLDEVSDWITGLARGNGADGKDLYRRCDRSCSPQYAWTIRSAGADELDVRAEVVCGPARDKADNAYRLASGLVWTCGAY